MSPDAREKVEAFKTVKDKLDSMLENINLKSMTVDATSNLFKDIVFSVNNTEPTVETNPFCNAENCTACTDPCK